MFFGRSLIGAMVYDEIARKAWAEQARSGVPGFDVNSVCLGIDKNLLQTVEALLKLRKPVAQTGGFTPRQT